jgi:hypothetical protein
MTARFVSHKLGDCPVCEKPIMIGHSIRIVRKNASDANSETCVTHYNCDEPTVEIYREPKVIKYTGGDAY